MTKLKRTLRNPSPPYPTAGESLPFRFKEWRLGRSDALFSVPFFILAAVVFGAAVNVVLIALSR